MMTLNNTLQYKKFPSWLNLWKYSYSSMEHAVYTLPAYTYSLKYLLSSQGTYWLEIVYTPDLEWLLMISNSVAPYDERSGLWHYTHWDKNWDSPVTSQHLSDCWWSRKHWNQHRGKKSQYINQIVRFPMEVELVSTIIYTQ